MDFSLLFFSSGEAPSDRYGVLIESSRFADKAGFESIWVPERHFSNFGCIFPNAALVLTALSRETSRIGLRAGSVALPLHHPARVAEEWAVLDNFSGGRAGMACATGWHPNDFVLAPPNYADRFRVAQDSIEALRRLWRGETVSFPGFDGSPVPVRTYPSPIQADLPLWLAVSSRPDSFELAGRLGLNVITHLLLHDIDTLQEKLALYRRAREAAGFDPATGAVTVWMYGYLARDAEAAVARGTEVLTAYFKSDARQIFNGLFFHHKNKKTDIGSLAASELDAYMQFVAQRLVQSGLVLFGSPQSCLPTIERLREAGVTEVACQADITPRATDVMTTVECLSELRTLWRHDTGAARVQGAARAHRARDLLSGSTDVLDQSAFYERFRAVGLDYAGGFRRIRRVWRGRGEVVAEIGAAEGEGAGPEMDATILDACVQAVSAALPPHLSRRLAVFEGLGEIAVEGPIASAAYSYVKLRSLDATGGVTFDVSIHDSDWREIGRIDACRIVSLSEESPQSAAPGPLAGFYKLEWRGNAAPAVTPARDATPRRIVLSTDGHFAEQLAGKLTACGLAATGSAIPATPGSDSGAASALPDDGPLEAIFVAKTLATSDSASTHDVWQEVTRECRALLSVIHGADGRVAPDVRLTLVCPLERDPDGEVAEVPPLKAPLVGMMRSLSLERPDLKQRIVLCDLDHVPSLAGELSREDVRDEIAVGREGRWARRLVEIPARAARPFAALGDGWYLVTGGTGAIGVQLCEWLVERGAGHVVLASRSGGEGDALFGERLRKLNAGGARVETVRMDVCDAEAVERLIRSSSAPLRGVCHAAGMLSDGLIQDLTDSDFESVMQPKIRGAWALHCATRSLDLQFFVCFSSTASLLGAPGQANYAAANAFLDALAAYRRAHSRSAISIQWGPWAGGGMAARAGAEAERRLEAQGVRYLSPDQGIRLLESALDQREHPVVAAVAVDWPRFVARLGANAPASLETMRAGAAPPGAESGMTASACALREALAGKPQDEMASTVTRAIQACVMRVLGAGTPCDLSRPLAELGIDSLMAVELKNLMKTEVGIDVPVVLILQGVSIEGLAAAVLDDVARVVLRDHAADSRTPAAAEELEVVELEI